MALFNRILVAIDLSPEALPVLKKVAAMAEVGQVEVCIMHVASSPNSAYSQWAIHESPISEQEIRSNLIPKLEVLVEQAGLSGQSLEVVFGKPADRVLEQAEHIDAELIVIGRHSREGVRALLGSTANAVINRASCDVLALQSS